MAGTRAWFDLDDGDQRKWAAVLDAASHHILRAETAQVAMCEASSTISGAAPWGEIAAGIKNRREFESEHPWAKRRVS